MVAILLLVCAVGFLLAAIDAALDSDATAVVWLLVAAAFAVAYITRELDGKGVFR